MPHDSHTSQDSKLQSDVQEALRREPSVTAAHIGVTANAGIVTLTGHVESLARKVAAETAARRVRGVKGLAEEIEVRLPSGTHRSDEEIALAAVDRIGWDVSILPDTVQVEVEDGWITLTGQVGWHYQRMAVEQDMRRMVGVAGVSNDVTIRPAITEADIAQEIVHALQRSLVVEPDRIAVTAAGGLVRLTGVAQTLSDRDEAGAIAWATCGTAGVENDIVVA